ncbi:MAG: OB-fold nucleic acid binding domain-containing protein [Anaerolineae bacterium]
MLLSTIGLALLWLLARGTDIPTVAISDVTGMMNLAYVRVSGHVVRGLTYDPESDYLGFWLLDETGEIHVNVYRDVTRELLNDGKVPAIGDEVTVAGTVRFREDFVSLTVDVPDHLEIQRPAATPRQARGVTPLDEGGRVRLAGTVKRITSPYEGLTLITLSDDSGDIVIAVDETTATLSGIPQGTAPLTHIAPGQTLVVEGTVTLYRGTPQVVPARISDIVLAGPTLTPEQPADEPADGLVAASPSEPTPRPSHAAPTSIHPAPTPSPSPSPTSQPLALSRLSAELEGETVRVAGKIVLLEGLRGGVKATLDDGTAQVVLLLWDNVHSALAAPASLDVGAEVAVTGTVQLYEGVLEIIPSDADDVYVLAPAPPPPWVAVNALTPNDAGRVVRIRGVLGELEGFSAGVKAPLNDGSGEITVLFWSNLYETFDPRPQAGQQVEITGLLSVFQQRLELIPRSPYDWRVKPPDGEAGNN